MCEFHHEFHSQDFLRDVIGIAVKCVHEGCDSSWRVAEAQVPGVPEGSALPECRFQPNFCPLNTIQLIPNAKKSPVTTSESAAQRFEVTCAEGNILVSSKETAPLKTEGGTCQRRAELVCSTHEGSMTGRAWKHSLTGEAFLDGDMECQRGRKIEYSTHAYNPVV